MNYPNNSLDSEEAVIGGLLLDPNIKKVLATGLVTQDFSNENLGCLFEYIKEMTDEGIHIDA